MTPQVRHYRVTVDFPETEREVLAVLCSNDYRPPDDQLRYLVMTEAQRRGLVKSEGDVQPASTPVTLGLNA